MGKKRTEVVNGVDVSVAGDELLHHALHGQPGGQDQRGGAVLHAGVQICGPVPDQNLQNNKCRVQLGIESNDSSSTRTEC